MYPNDYRLSGVDLPESHVVVPDKLPLCDWKRAKDRAILETVVMAMPLVAVVFVVIALVLWQAA